jgi:DNA ligase-4
MLEEIWALDRQSNIGKYFHNWKIGHSLDINVKGQGNLGSVVEQVVKYLSITPFHHTVSKVAFLLHELALTSAWSTDLEVKETRKPIKIIEELFRAQSPRASKWMTRIILKNMAPLYMEWNQIMQAFHPCMPSLHRIQAKLSQTCDTITQIIKSGYSASSITKDGNFDKNLYSAIMREFGKPELGVFISTMECIQAKSVAHVFYNAHSEKAEFIYAETKYDGERMQIHFDGRKQEKIIIYSKSGRNSTNDRILAHP